jgi:hypothetical protein
MNPQVKQWAMGKDRTRLADSSLSEAKAGGGYQSTD